MNKDQKLLEEAYENIVQNLQHSQAKEAFYKNVMTKFMNESQNKNMQGFQTWLDSQVGEGKNWNDNQEYQKMHEELEKSKIISSDRVELFKDLTEYVSRNIGSDERAWAVEA